MTNGTPQPATAAAPDPAALLRSPSYLGLLVFGAITGVPVAVVADLFLHVVAEAQTYVFTTLPSDLGFDGQPGWWPILPLMLSGLLVALTIQYLPGEAGHKPAEGFKTGGPVRPIELPGIMLAAFLTLSLGVVLGPEAPLIAIGSGMGVLAVHLIKRDAPAMATMVIGGAGSFAAIATLLGSPLAGAFLLMEAAGLGGAMMGVVLVPGLVAAAVGSLIYVGLDNWTGFGTFSLAIPDIPTAGSPTLAQFLWAIAIGVSAALLGAVITRGALFLQRIVERRMLLLDARGRALHRRGHLGLRRGDRQDVGRCPVLRPGSVGTVDHQCIELDRRGAHVAPGVQVVGVQRRASSFRGGPVFPGMFIGAVGGMALSASSRSADDRRRGDGNRRHDGGDARLATRVGPAGGAVPASTTDSS